jgi:hypothetical protein
MALNRPDQVTTVECSEAHITDFRCAVWIEDDDTHWYWIDPDNRLKCLQYLEKTARNELRKEFRSSPPTDGG